MSSVMRPEGELILTLRHAEETQGAAVIRGADLKLLNKMIAEYESTICWSVNCVHVAQQLDKDHAEYERGHRSATDEAVRKIEDEIAACDRAGARAGTDLMLRPEVVKLLRAMRDKVRGPVS